MSVAFRRVSEKFQKGFRGFHYSLMNVSGFLEVFMAKHLQEGSWVLRGLEYSSRDVYEDLEKVL